MKIPGPVRLRGLIQYEVYNTLFHVFKRLPKKQKTGNEGKKLLEVWLFYNIFLLTHLKKERNIFIRSSTYKYRNSYKLSILILQKIVYH